MSECIKRLLKDFDNGETRRMLLEEVMTLGCFFCQVEHFVELHKPVSKLTDCFEAGDLIQRRDQIREKKIMQAEKAEKANKAKAKAQLKADAKAAQSATASEQPVEEEVEDTGNVNKGTLMAAEHPEERKDAGKKNKKKVKHQTSKGTGKLQK